MSLPNESIGPIIRVEDVLITLPGPLIDKLKSVARELGAPLGTVTSLMALGGLRSLTDPLKTDRTGLLALLRTTLDECQTATEDEKRAD